MVPPGCERRGGDRGSSQPSDEDGLRCPGTGVRVVARACVRPVTHFRREGAKGPAAAAPDERRPEGRSADLQAASSGRGQRERTSRDGCASCFPQSMEQPRKTALDGVLSSGAGGSRRRNKSTAPDLTIRRRGAALRGPGRRARRPKRKGAGAPPGTRLHHIIIRFLPDPSGAVKYFFWQFAD
jgi:hypothetical protein